MNFDRNDNFSLSRCIAIYFSLTKGQLSFTQLTAYSLHVVTFLIENFVTKSSKSCNEIATAKNTFMQEIYT